MSNSVTYEAEGGATWTFIYPTVTVTQTVVPSMFGYARMSTRYVYTVRSLLVANDANDLAAKKEDAATILTFVGGTFTWNRDGADVVQWGISNDTNFGPKPVSLSFERFFDVQCAIVTWQVEIEIAAVDNDIVDLVYSVTHTLDKNYYTTRTISGFLRLNGAHFSATQFKGVDQYRKTIQDYVCSIPPGWQRVSSNFHMMEDGLTLVFDITDIQQYAVLPPNVSDGSVSISVEGNPRYGNHKDFRLDGWYESPTDSPDAPQQAFVSLASSLFNMTITNEAFRVKLLSLTKDLYRCRLRFTMVWDAFEPDQSTSGVPGDTPTEKTANWMLLLMTRADTWLQQFKGGTSTDKSLYGTTDVNGWCGTGTIAPVLTAAGYQQDRDSGGIPGNTSTTGSGADQSILPQGETYFYKYYQHFNYITDMGVKVLPLKDTTKDDVFQQVRAPSVYICVHGCAVTHGDVLDIPAPPYSPTDAVLLEATRYVEEPKDGPEYTLHWKYFMKIKKSYNGTTPDSIKIPYSPYLPADLFDNTSDPARITKKYSDFAFVNSLT